MNSTYSLPTNSGSHSRSSVWESEHPSSSLQDISEINP